MNPKKIWANLAVENIVRTQEFYTKLGFRLNGNPVSDLVSFLIGEDDFVVHFFQKDRLKASLEGELADLSQGNEIMFSLSASSKKEYDEWVTEIKEAGGTVLFDSNIDKNQYYDENNFYVCVFADPDGHKFNLLYSENM